MKSKPLICGIDVSKDKLDVFYNKEGRQYSLQVNNNVSGHNALIKKLGINRTYILESTGVYSLRICLKLKKAGADVRVENPLIIKRFIQMNRERHKTDKSDARWIFAYGQEREATVWRIPSKAQLYCSQILSAIDIYKRELVGMNNHLQGLQQHPVANTFVKTSLEQARTKIKKEIIKLEEKLELLLTEWQGNLKSNLLTIPGLGKLAVAYLIVFTDGFTKFQNPRQLIAYAGTSPRVHTSGTSVHLKKGICKMGNFYLRKTLYMCSLNAIRRNKACKEQYERLKAAGKKPKVALIAVCNKLLRQAFAIAQTGIPYQADHKSILKDIKN